MSVYCDYCGERDNLAYIGSTASGDHYTCITCGSEFSVTTNWEDEYENNI